MNQGGDRGKSPNITGTRPKKRRADAPATTPGRQDVKSGVKKTPRGTTTRSADK
jgi:hypothetical protein